MYYGGLPYQVLPWSFSKLKLAQRCGFSAQEQCKGVLPAALLAPKMPEATDGIFIHSYLHWCIRSAESEAITIDYDMPELARPLPQEYFTNITKFMSQHLPTLKKKVGDDCKVYPECKIFLDYDLKPCLDRRNAFIVGQPDLILMNKDRAIIVDFKSERLTLHPDRGDQETQLKIYSLMLCKGVFEVKEVACSIYYVFTDTFKNCLVGERSEFRIYKDYGPLYLEDLKEEVAKAMASLRKAERTPGFFCKYCDIRHKCDKAMI